MDQQKSVKQRHTKNRHKDDQHGAPLVDGSSRHSLKKSKTSTKASSSWKQSVLQGLCLSVVFFFLASYIITDTWLWGYKGKYTNLRYWFPPKELVFTQKELSQYDGSDPTKNIYLAIKGEVFDVTAGRPYYSKGGGYGFFSGKDASRAYTTGCFQTHLTHDLRGLTAQQLADIDGWANFYRNHQKYFKVGTVILDPIDPASPIPEDCRQPVAPKPSS
ncbi:hypothetical protein BG015_000662 [Linnemannia schmuckeri]|uniref:Cytochrome b5 heme-binding domain-containing protein n=1 Tax=Linnemannia schmuckeri TaxID=64567 RepID=A0A9P5RQT7_9FUNG|nr:hypothetical protein BG015_000662 [Linnemannia schmuckeri]